MTYSSSWTMIDASNPEYQLLSAERSSILVCPTISLNDADELKNFLFRQLNMPSPTTSNAPDPPCLRLRSAHATAQSQASPSTQRALSLTPTDETLSDPGNTLIRRKVQRIRQLYTWRTSTTSTTHPTKKAGKVKPTAPPKATRAQSRAALPAPATATTIVTEPKAPQLNKARLEEGEPYTKQVKDVDQYWSGLESAECKKRGLETRDPRSTTAASGSEGTMEELGLAEGLQDGTFKYLLQTSCRDDYDIRRMKKSRAESSEGSASTLTFSQSSSSTRSASIVVEIEKEDPYIISPSHRLQKLLNSNNVPYGVQFELARLTTTGELRYDNLDVSKPMKLANKSNAGAVPELPKVLQREWQRGGKMFAKEEAAKSLG
ncbi:hypothetical protein BDN72DRAFT_904778 [Pluteus cervinus]|uniref:Uncharacterized protein n=1 Tax=Pluteus cervinus TaxID=181527 RepID=A0ACD3A4P1_9AGAR|nr:hypothetical protein BDN72DRAFT_904778 [Pluteus cervinus]